MHWIVDPDTPTSLEERELSDDCLTKVLTTQRTLDKWLRTVEDDFTSWTSGKHR